MDYSRIVGPALAAARPRGKFLQQPGELRARHGARAPLRATPQLNHNINASWPLGHGTKHLPHHALHSIAVDRARRDAPAGDDTDTRLGQAVGPDVKGEIAPRPRFTVRQRRAEMLAPLQPRAARQRAIPLAQALNRARPLARRARSTPRPPRVCMRARKPWVRLRRFTEG